nr:hypothetical protein [Corynebacterium lactis]
MDFGPEVRFHPDAYLGAGPESEDSPVIGDASADALVASAREFASASGLGPKNRVVSHGWIDDATAQVSATAWAKSVLAPWTVDGAAVVVRGGDGARLEEVAKAEKATIVGR